MATVATMLWACTCGSAAVGAQRRASQDLVAATRGKSSSRQQSSGPSPSRGHQGKLAACCSTVQATTPNKKKGAAAPTREGLPR